MGVENKVTTFASSDRSRRMIEGAIGAEVTLESAATLPRSLVLLFAAACGLSVANVYYAQPLLDAMGREFRMSDASVGLVVTATQVGCALALVFVVPLGDLWNRRRLILGQLGLLVVALAAVGCAFSVAGLLAGMVAVGLLGTAMTQGLVAYSAALAGPTERGRVVGAAQSGVVIGLLMARTLAGILADLAGWRAVYFVSLAMMVLMGLVLLRMLPEQRFERATLSYMQLLRSMFALFIQEPVLRVRGIIALLMFAVFSVFWTSLVLPLSASPLSLSHTVIGSFGLAGVAGALAAARAGHLADRGLAQWTTGVALVLLLGSWLPIAFLKQSLLVLVVGVIALDLAGQALHVTNQSLIFKVRPEAHSRLVGCYMLFYSVGSGLGSISSTAVYASGGWTGVCLLGASLSVLALLFWWGTLPRGADGK